MNEAMTRIRTFVEPLLNEFDNSYTTWDPKSGSWI